MSVDLNDQNSDIEFAEWPQKVKPKSTVLPRLLALTMLLVIPWTLCSPHLGWAVKAAYIVALIFCLTQSMGDQSLIQTKMGVQYRCKKCGKAQPFYFHVAGYIENQNDYNQQMQRVWNAVRTDIAIAHTRECSYYKERQARKARR